MSPASSQSGSRSGSSRRDSRPRYPQVRVKVRSSNPLAAISAIRGALRRAGVSRSEIRVFSQQAFGSDDLDRLSEVCHGWVRVEAPTWSGRFAGPWPPANGELRA